MKPQFLSRFATSPDLLPFALDSANDNVMVVQLSKELYRSSSFLDQRIITPQIPRGNTRWQDLAEAMNQPNSPPDFIFHIGHVGSTLISRLLGELEDTHALREPLLLRHLAEIGETNNTPECMWSPDRYARRIKDTVAWLSRTYEPSQTALIKASSFVSAIAGDILPYAKRTIALFVPPERYIATIMAGEASRQELAQLSAKRLSRLHHNINAKPLQLWEMDEPMRAAISWAAEMTSLITALGETDSETVKWVNFDAFLENPETLLSEIASFFRYEHEKAEIVSLINGPLMRQYSKAPEHDYSAELRATLLEEAKVEHADKIANAMDWLNQAAGKYTLIAKAMKIGETR